MPPQPKSKGCSKGATAGGAKGKGGKKAGASTPPPAAFQAVLPIQPVIQEDVWVQCDLCNKWRRLPPATELADDAPWDCTMNPDPQRNSCASPEEDYDASKEVVIASTDPYYANLVPKDVESLKKELLEKAGFPAEPQLQPPAPKQASSAKQRKGTPEPGFGAALPYGSRKQQQYQQSRLGTKDQAVAKGPTLKEELEQVVKALQQIMANAGSWDVNASHSLTSPPAWVWQALLHLVPEAIQEAVFAFEALSAMRCMCNGSSAQQAAQAAAAAAAGEGASASSTAPQPSTTPGTLPPEHTATLGQLEALARLALMTATSLALPKVQQAQAQQQARAQQAMHTPQHMTLLLDPVPYTAHTVTGGTQSLNRQHSNSLGAMHSQSQGNGSGASGLPLPASVSQSAGARSSTPQHSQPPSQQLPVAFNMQQGMQQQSGSVEPRSNQAGSTLSGLQQMPSGLQNHAPHPSAQPQQPSPGLSSQQPHHHDQQNQQNQLQQQRFSPTQLAQLGLMLGAAGKSTLGLPQQVGMNGLPGLNPAVLQAFQQNPQQLQAALAAGLLPGLQQQLLLHQQLLQPQASQQLQIQQQQQQQQQQQGNTFHNVPANAGLQAALLGYQHHGVSGAAAPAGAQGSLPIAAVQGMVPGAAALPQQMQQVLPFAGALGLSNQGQMLQGQQLSHDMIMTHKR